MVVIYCNVVYITITYDILVVAMQDFVLLALDLINKEKTMVFLLG